MNKILIKVSKNKLIFSNYDNNSIDKDINKTNVIDIKNLKFSNDYIEKNEVIVSSYIKLICLKNNINEIDVVTNNIAIIALKIIKNIDCIEKVNFLENDTLSYLVCDLLYDNKNVKYINAYNIPEVLFHRFQDRNIFVRNEILLLSDFMADNNINTYYELCTKKSIKINDLLSNTDMDDLEYFFKVNKECKKIYFQKYNKNLLIKILDIIKYNKLSNITCILIDDKTKNINNDLKLFPKIMKKYNVKIKIISDQNKKYEMILLILRIIIFILSFSLLFNILLKI